MQLGFGRRRPSIRYSRPKTLTASGERVNAQRAEQQARVNSSWQRRAFYYFDALGEIKYAASFYARLSKLKLYAGEWQEEENGERTLVPTRDKQAIAALARLRDPGGSGGRAGLLGSYGRLMFLTGEAILFYTKDADGLEQWEILSTSELRTNPTGSSGGKANYQRIKAPALSPENYRDPGDDDWEDVDAREAIVFRLWRRHPQYSQWPDSPMRGVLEICEQLLMLDRAARSRSISRTAGNGILWLDDRISEPPPTPEPDDETSADPFVDDLTATMTEPMTDEGSASHVVPMVARISVPVSGPGETPLKVEDLVYHMRLTEPGEFYPEADQIERVIHRLALDLEMPPEVLEGKSGGNHWSAWEVSEDAWEHLEPYAQAFCDDVTSAYYLPTLAAGKVENWERFAIGYDPASLRREPERSKDSKDLHDRGVLSDEALRTANDFTEDDAPSDAERRVWLSRFSKDPGFALGEDPARSSVPAAEIGQDGDETTPGPLGDPSNVEPGTPDTNPADSAPSESATVQAQVLGALEVAVHRARELASNRVVTRAKRDTSAKAALDSAPSKHAPFVLGQTVTRRLCGGATEATMVDGVRSAVATPLRRWGLTDEQVEQILAAVIQHAAVTLYDETQRPFPPPFRRYVAEVVRNGSNGNGSHA